MSVAPNTVCSKTSVAMVIALSLHDPVKAANSGCGLGSGILRLIQSVGLAVTEITELLHAMRDGDGQAMDAVFDRVYPQLRALASGQMMVRAGHTITPTVLVNETYLKLIKAKNLDLIDRRHFMICAARAMRMIMIDYARAKGAQRRGGDQQRVTLTDVGKAGGGSALDLLDLDDALADLEAIDPQLKELVELKFFAGLTMSEIAQLSDSSLSTVNRNWSRARAFLHTQLT